MVNQNQTYRQEIQDDYLWPLKRNANGVRNPFYESMRQVSPGDIVFSFVDTRITAIGIARSYCWESPKPQEFGSTGQNWENVVFAEVLAGLIGTEATSLMKVGEILATPPFCCVRA